MNTFFPPLKSSGASGPTGFEAGGAEGPERETLGQGRGAETETEGTGVALKPGSIGVGGTVKSSGDAPTTSPEPPTIQFAFEGTTTVCKEFAVFLRSAMNHP